MTRIVIRHTSGSKANQVEEFELDQLEDMVIGRDPQARIRFDPDKDDLVSRRHARITCEPGERPAFRIIDLNSSNGLFINGARVMGGSALLPGDEVHLGLDGPRFIFDFEPRPDYMVARTRVFMAAASDSAGDVKVTMMSPSARPNPPDAAPKPGGTPASVGRATLERLIACQGRVSRRALYGTAAGTLGLMLVGSGVLYAAQRSGAHTLEKQLGDQIRTNGAAVQAASAEIGHTQGRILDKYGAKTPREIAQENADAVVMIRAAWKLFDNNTGKQLFHKHVPVPNRGMLPAYIRVGNKTLYWLTTDDQKGQNTRIGEEDMTGSGFVVSSNGFVMTNKHVAAGWLRPYQPPENGLGVVFPLQLDRQAGDVGKPEIAQVDAQVKDWVPTEGFVFESSAPRPMYMESHSFVGHDDTDVLFPRNKIGTKAHFVRASDRADVAMIKVDMPDALDTVHLAPQDYNLKLGEPISVLGYPVISPGRYVVTRGNDLTGITETPGIVPEPTLTNGIISKVNSGDVPPVTPDRNVQMTQVLGDYFQLTDTATGGGNSGGPVFNSEGQVIGIFTAARTDGQGTRVTFGIPIKYGREIYGRSPVIAKQ